MYLQYFGLAEAPFSITPDPAFVYLSQRHRDALAHLLYGIGQGGSGGFVQLTGEVGTGKTTLCRCLLEQVPADTHIALILNPLMTPAELLAAVCEELEIDVRGMESSSKQLVDRLNQFLLAAHQAGERVVLVIDEAQNMSPEALEQVRLLTNLETSKQKLLQIVLLGQPELRELLQRRSLRQLAQRITARYHLTPLSLKDARQYVQHRLQVAGAARNPFRASALRALYQRSHGVPRVINIIADRALVGAYAGELQDIDAGLVHAAADEVQLGEPGARRSRWPWVAAAASGVLLAVATYFMLPGSGSSKAVVTPGMTEVPDHPAVVPVDEPARETAVASLPGALDQAWLDLQHPAAWQGLATLWNDPSGGSELESACRDNGRSAWACIRDTGSLARILQLGLPVVLVLQADSTGTRFLLLQGAADDRLLVGAPAATLTVARRAVENRWLGSYFVAWPQAPDWPREVTKGDRGPAVDTILELAAQADEPYPGGTEFDNRFEGWLKDFQGRYGLEADGIVGPKTLLYLMRSSITSPALMSDWPTES